MKGIKGIHERQFTEVVKLIRNARINALKSVNQELIGLYWNIGEYISRKIQKAEWGGGIVSQLASYIKEKYPEFRGYSDKNLWRMKQFYETYFQDKKLSPLVRVISWTNNLLILSKSKSSEERELLQNKLHELFLLKEKNLE